MLDETKLLDLVDPTDSRLRPPTKMMTGQWVMRVPCENPTGHSWKDVFETNKHGWKHRVRSECRHCKREKRSCYANSKEPVPTASGLRGPLSNHEFIALYLIKHGPTHPDIMREKLREFRSLREGENLAYGRNYVRPFISSGAGGMDSKRNWWCGDGTRHLDRTYWWCPKLPKVKGNRKDQLGELRLSTLGLATAAIALSKAARALGITSESLDHRWQEDEHGIVR